MFSKVCFSLCVVTVVSSLVVRQPDGIISIITELEPEKTPVAYLQAIDGPPGRGSPTVIDETPTPPLAEGEFRVRSAKIQVVDPKTGFKVVHHSVVPEVQDDNKNAVKSSGGSERRSGIQAEPATDYKIVYPSIVPEGLTNYKNSKRFNKENDPRNGFQRQRKLGKYGYQTPRRENTVRTEKTTRIRNNDEPTKVYKQTVVRPVTEEDEIRKVRKYGKNGRFGKYTSQQPIPNPIPGVGEVIDSSDVGSEVLSVNEPGRKNTQKEYSSRTVMRFPDGYAQGNERRTESSSKFKTGSNLKNNYRTPTAKTSTKNGNRKFDVKRIPYTRPTPNDKIEIDQPLQEAGSLLGGGVIDGVDDGLVDDSGVIYSSGGYNGGVGGYSNGGYSGHEDGYGGGFDKEKHFEKEKGKEYIAAHDSAHGAKGQKGHNNEEAFSKGQSEQHGQDENKGYDAEKEGEKKSHLDKSTQFASGHQTSEDAKGSDFQKEKGHRKGHKKSGFRKVQHKDEYNKNEEFYDEEHSSGEEKQQGHRTEEHAEKSGGNDKKAYLDSGHHQASRGHEGGHEKGHGYNQQKGYQKDKGHAGHYDNEEEYGKKSGHKEGEVHGHSEFGGGGHGYH